MYIQYIYVRIVSTLKPNTVELKKYIWYFSMSDSQKTETMVTLACKVIYRGCGMSGGSQGKGEDFLQH